MKIITIDDLGEVGAHLRGHFQLTTGRHSDQFFLFARLTERPDRLRPWAQALAQELKEFGVSTVVGPAIGGIIPAFAVAQYIPESRVLFAEKGGEIMELKRGFRLAKEEPVIVIEDAVTTGGSVRKTMAAVQRAGGEVRAIGALIDRSGGTIDWDVPFKAVLTVDNIVSYLPEECPLCQEGIPLTRPKS